MPDRLIIDCRNLIGDTIYLVKPLRQFLISHHLADVALGVADGLPADIVKRSFPDLPVERTEKLEALWPDADRIRLSARLAWEKTRSDHSHISIGYARILGIQLADGIDPDTAWLPPFEASRPEHIALAPFSVSCARYRGEAPNKTLNEPDWMPLLDVLRSYGLPLRVLGTPTERFAARELGFSESDYFSAGGIEEMVGFLRRSQLVVGVDTGVCHVSSCAAIPTVVLWSAAASLSFIGETWAPRTRIVQIGVPTSFDAYRVGGLLAGAMTDLVGSPPHQKSPEGAADRTDDQPVRAVFPALDSVSWTPERVGVGGLRNWSGHLPFARDLVASLHPRLLVELGTHYGESYFGFCQSVAETGGSCACYAVDTWAGDPHSLPYGEEVYSNVLRHNSATYASFSRLMRTTFDEALPWFAEGSIDLLHIDGMHTYEAVKHDFEAWYPKVAAGGIVLLHDTAHRHADFGVWRLWEELSRDHEAFEFQHSHGLGVIRKFGVRRTLGGILDYLFTPENAERIRRYYALCSKRVERIADAATYRPDDNSAITDPPPETVKALAQPDGEGRWIELAAGIPGYARNDWEPGDGMWCANTPDPWVQCPVTVSCSEFRFFVLQMSCSTRQPKPYAQLFWSGPERAGFNERLSVRFPVIPDGRPHTYVVDLHAGVGPGAVNYLWWHPGIVDVVRLDPLDVPGEFNIALAGIAHQDAVGAEEVRDRLKLLPLRTELSYRYLRGSGIEIGALQSPLQMRPDTHIRYADRLTVDEARAHYPELDPHPLVTPSIICDAAILTPVADRSVDFVVANHVLEHLRDPLAALREWLRVVRPGGCLYIAVPDHNNPLDRLRPITPVEHMVADYENRRSRLELDRAHYREWVASTRPDVSREDQDKQQAHLEAIGYAIHFHTFTRETFAALMEAAATQFRAERVEVRQGSTGEQTEYIAILRRL